MDLPLLLVPFMDESYRDLMNISTGMKHNHKSNKLPTAGMYSYPLRKNYYSASATDKVRVIPAIPINISAHFSLGIQVKPKEVLSASIIDVRISDKQGVNFAMLPSGNLSIRYLVLRSFCSSVQIFHIPSTSVNKIIYRYHPINLKNEKEPYCQARDS